MPFLRLTSRRPNKAILFALLTLSLCLPPRAVWAESPPSAPHAAAALSGYYVYLPFVTQTAAGATVDIRNRQSSLTFYKQEFVGSQAQAISQEPQAAQAATINWTGSQATCNAGTTDATFRQAVLRRVNYFRSMAGVPASVSFSDDFNRRAQAAALMMSANRALSHSPPTSWACYTTDGADAAGSSNLYLGTYGGDAITGYMRDPGSANSAAGHRRWILYPQTQTMGTGDVPAVNGYPAANDLRVFDTHMGDARPAVRDDFVAWPPPGYVPYPIVFARWTFAYPGADFSAATVSMQSGGAPVSVAQSSPANGYGENTLVWIPLGMSDSADWPRPALDTTYVVTIRNVKINGQPRSFTYSVIVFDPQ